MANKYLSLNERFWSKVKKTKSCWVWSTAKPGKPGYISINGKVELAHRASWFIHYGVFPGNLYVCHKCDNPPCVNPSHLFLGTQKDNMSDCAAKKRTARPSLSLFCKHGHAMNGSNIRIAKRGKYKIRICLPCMRVFQKKYKLRKRLAELESLQRGEK